MNRKPIYQPWQYTITKLTLRIRDSPCQFYFIFDRSDTTAILNNDFYSIHFGDDEYQIPTLRPYVN